MKNMIKRRLKHRNFVDVADLLKENGVEAQAQWGRFFSDALQVEGYGLVYYGEQDGGGWVVRDYIGTGADECITLDELAEDLCEMIGR